MVGKLLKHALMFGAAAAVIPGWAAAQSGGSASPAIDEGPSVEEIVVTAQKREERLQDVPVAVTALSGAQLDVAGVSSTQELTRVTPGLNFSQASFSAQPYVRGVGSRGVSGGDELNVPIYVDGVYEALPTAAFFDLANISRIEVLKGPQGTLFGRNALGGAINVVTESPSRGFGGKLGFETGNYKLMVGDIYVTGPVTETLSANLAIHARRQDGYIHDIVRNDDLGSSSAFVVRGKILYQPTDTSRTIIGLNYMRNTDNSAISGHPRDGVTSARNTVGAVIADGYQAALSFHPYFNLQQASASVQNVLSFSSFDLTSLASVAHTRFGINTDSDLTNINSASTSYTQNAKVYTGEMRAASTTAGPFHWIGGVFLFADKVKYPQYLSGASQFTSTQWSRAYAVFAEGTYDLTEALSLTGGLRYSYEERDFYSERLTGALIADASSSFEKVSPRVVARYEFSPRVSVYASYSQGFKSGLFNATQTSGTFIPVNPEVLDAFEIGAKTEPFRWLRVNAAVYQYDYKDIQISARNPMGTQTLQNAGSAKISGAEIEINATPVRGWNIRTGLAYNHARFGQFTNCCLAYTPKPDKSGNIGAEEDVTGKPISRAPDWTFNLGSDYSFDLWDGEATVAASYYYNGGYSWEPSNRIRQDAYNTVSGKLSWREPGDRWQVSLWGENLTDSDHELVVVISASATNSILVRPRTYGVRLDFDF